MVYSMLRHSKYLVIDRLVVLARVALLIVVNCGILTVHFLLLPLLVVFFLVKVMISVSLS